MEANLNLTNVLVDYMPAQLHEGKRWYIDFYIKDPETNKLKRKQIKVNRIKSITERRKFAKAMVQKINIKLSQGWNPHIEQEAGKSFHTLSQASSAYLSDKRDLRPDTIKLYKQVLKRINGWCENEYGKDLFIINFTRNVAIKFLENVWGSGVGANRFNFYIHFGITYFNWLIEHNYSKANPFLGVTKKRETAKIRVMEIQELDREKIKDYLLVKDRRFLAMVYLTFHSLLRPKEIMHLRGRHINLEKQTVTVEGQFSKNHKERIGTMPNVMMELITETMNGVGDNYYIFSNRFKSGKTPFIRRYVNKAWAEMRTELKLDFNIQYYSLRDSGIIQKLKDGLDAKTVMELADHSSLNVTNKYVKAAKSEANTEAMGKMSAF